MVQVDVSISPIVHSAPEAKRRAFADPADFVQIPEHQYQGSGLVAVGHVNGAAVVHLDQGASTSFEDQRLALVTRKPVIRGTRMTGSLIVGSLAGGMSFEEVEREYGLVRDQVRAALKFAGELDSSCCQCSCSSSASPRT